MRQILMLFLVNLRKIKFLSFDLMKKYLVNDDRKCHYYQFYNKCDEKLTI